MRQKKYLHTRRSPFTNNSYKSFRNESQTDNILTTSTRNNNSILDVLKLPKKPCPKKWEEFYTNGRTEFHTNCLLLCSVLIKEPCYYFWKENDNANSNENAHAEMRALQSISSKEEKLQTKTSLVVFYLTYSPCGTCADGIISFLAARPTCNMLLYFSCIYRHDKERMHRDGLRKLNACSGVKVISVFTGKEWQELAANCGVKFSQNDSFRNYFDDYWKKELQHVLSEHEYDDQPWTSKQKPPRFQYLEDGGDPTIIRYEMACRYGIQTRRFRRFKAMGNKKSVSAAVVIFIIVIFFIAAIMNGWISTEGSAPKLNVTNDTN